ncbi:hypothetical protein EDD85DRAFT_942373 [Armillaria nabsnona]|nr:hypothetical protein EDD85DRAFT_942373 [Armillaria nabsnona]
MITETIIVLGFLHEIIHVDTLDDSGAGSNLSCVVPSYSPSVLHHFIQAFMLDQPTSLLKNFSTPTSIDIMGNIFSRSGLNPQFGMMFKEVLNDHRKEREIDEVPEIGILHMCRIIQRVGYLLSLYTRSEQFIDTFRTPESEELNVDEIDYPENRDAFDVVEFETKGTLFVISSTSGNRTPPIAEIGELTGWIDEPGEGERYGWDPRPGSFSTCTGIFTDSVTPTVKHLVRNGASPGRGPYSDIWERNSIFGVKTSGRTFDGRGVTGGLLGCGEIVGTGDI